MIFTAKVWLVLFLGGGSLAVLMGWACLKRRKGIANLTALVLTLGGFVFLLLWGTNTSGIQIVGPTDFEKNIVLAAAGGLAVQAVRWMAGYSSRNPRRDRICQYWLGSVVAGVLMGIMGWAALVAVATMANHPPSDESHFVHAFFGLCGGGVGWKLPDYFERAFNNMFWK